MQRSNQDLAGGEIQLDRRAFLSGTGALVVGLTAPGAWAQNAPPSPASVNNRALLATKLDSYLTVGKDGMVEVYFGAIDGGQGLETAIAQMVAEELDIGFDSVHIVMGDTARTLNMGGASGAQGIARRGTSLMKAAAHARRILLQNAATQLGAPVDKLVVTNGVISVSGEPARKTSYAEVVSADTFRSDIKWNGVWGNGHDVETDAPRKSYKDYKLIGQSIRRKDLPKKVFAQQDFPATSAFPACYTRA